MPTSPLHPITGWFDPATLDDDPEPDLRPLDQASRPHIFVNKLHCRAGANKTLSTLNAPSRDLSISDWAALYAAGEVGIGKHWRQSQAREQFFRPDIQEPRGPASDGRITRPQAATKFGAAKDQPYIARYCAPEIIDATSTLGIRHPRHPPTALCKGVL